jgi:hypothetical protein
MTSETSFTELDPSEASPGHFHVLTTTSVALHLAVTVLTLLRDAHHSPPRKMLSSGPLLKSAGPVTN